MVSILSHRKLNSSSFHHLCRNPDSSRVIRDVGYYHCTSTYFHIVSHINIAHNNCPCPYIAVFTNCGIAFIGLPECDTMLDDRPPSYLHITIDNDAKTGMTEINAFYRHTLWNLAMIVPPDIVEERNPNIVTIPPTTLLIP